MIAKVAESRDRDVDSGRWTVDGGGGGGGSGGGARVVVEQGSWLARHSTIE